MTTAQLESRYSSSARRAAGATRFTVAFCGTFISETELRLGNFAGSAGAALDGLVLNSGLGLGGQVMATSRAMALDDYLTAGNIRHHYDDQIRRENLHAIAATPVIVNRTQRAVIYVALHVSTVIGDRVLDLLASEARQLEQELAVDDALAAGVALSPALSGNERGELFAQLRGLAARIDDESVRNDLLGACSQVFFPDGEGASLTPREIDVVALVARGRTNAQVARILGLTVNTVKSYLRSASQRLGAVGRLELAVMARSAGLIP